MMDLTKWLRLWEKDDAMWPRYDGHRLLFDDGKVGYRVYINDRVGSPFARLSDETAAALIRDRAVWWLADRHSDRGVVLCQIETMSCVSILPQDDRHLHADQTDSLYLACCKVLGVEP